MKKHKILITGSLGLVGSACVDLFTVKGWDVTGVDANKRADFFGTSRQWKAGTWAIDIRDEKAVRDVFVTQGPFDAIIHAAGQPSHDWATNHVLEDFDTNARGTVILLEAYRAHSPLATFIHVSTDKVYGENMNGVGEGFDEHLGLDFAGKRSFFGCSKTAADVYAQEYMNYLRLPIGIFRPGCITGKNHQGAPMHGFLAYIAKCVREGIHYTINGFNGRVVRDQIHASDLAEAFWHFIQSPKPGVYNIGGGPERAISVMEAIHAFEKLYKKDASYEISPTHRPGDREWDVIDCTKFRLAYPEWQYRWSLQDILNDFI